MAVTTKNKRIQVGDLDFDQIKSNIKSYLKGQDEFSDYDFEGSALSTLVDVLAYNTHYNAIYTNLAVNESFLDSASKRASVVSLAKSLGYTPRSARCPRATITATLGGADPAATTASLPIEQPFSTVVNGKTYNFFNTASQTVSRAINGNFVFTDVELIQGTKISHRYTYGTGQRFLIQNENCDTSTLTVRVQPNAASDQSYVYTQASTILDINEESRIYFIKEIEGGLYEITFGDDILGRQLEEGNVISITYYVSDLDEANYAKTFTYNGATLLSGTVSCTAISSATGGAAPEDIDSIKHNAPRMYAAQNRAVTPDDYKALIYTLYPEARSVTVWGGENNSPPVYGKTYICVKPEGALKLTQTQKDYINNNILQQRNIVTITPELVDPEYFNIKVTSFVYYDPRQTTKTALEIANQVKQEIFNYDETTLAKFDSMLRYSKLVRLIDDADPAITNNITRVMVRRQFSPAYNISAEYKLTLINPISQDGGKQGKVFSSTGFYIPNSTRIHFLDDDSAGNVRLYYVNEQQEQVFVNKTIGTIDYEAGQVVVRNLTITKLDGPVFEMQVKPESYDVVCALNQIVTIDRDLIEIRAIADQTAAGDLQAGFNYDFNSIRS
jgi:hypothetical protein